MSWSALFALFEYICCGYAAILIVHSFSAKIDSYFRRQTLTSTVVPRAERAERNFQKRGIIRDNINTPSDVDNILKHKLVNASW